MTNSVRLIAAFLVIGSGYASPAAAQLGLQVIQLNGTLGEFKEKSRVLNGEPIGDLIANTANGPEHVEFKQDKLDVRGSGGLEVLQRGAYVAVQGEADGKGKISNARLTLYVKGFAKSTEKVNRFLPQQVVIQNGFFTSQAATADQIPVLITGTVQSVSPLVINGTNLVQTRYNVTGDLQKNGTPIYRRFVSIGKSFEILPQVDSAGAASILIDLGDLKNAGANAEVNALVLAIQDRDVVGVTWPVVTVTRKEAIDPSKLRFELARLGEVKTKSP